MKRIDCSIIALCLCILITCVYTLGEVKDCERRCDERYKPYIKSLKPQHKGMIPYDLNLTGVKLNGVLES